MTEKYRRRPVVIEAQQLTDENMAKVAKWCGGHVATTGRMRVSTLEGEMWCSPGSWIIKGAKGEFYPVQDSIFQATYEPVEAAEDDPELAQAWTVAEARSAGIDGWHFVSCPTCDGTGRKG